MSQYPVSAALLRTLKRPARTDDATLRRFESGQGTRPATRAFERQGASISAEKAIRQVRKPKPKDERQKEILRRRKWAGGGNMPPAVRQYYSEAERAALSVVADVCKRRGFCDLCIDEIARLAGVGRTTVQNALRKARSKDHPHISMKERPQPGGRSLTNVIKIVCTTWLSWVSRAIGFKRLSTSKTEVKISLSETAEPSKEALEMARADRSNASVHVERASTFADWTRDHRSMAILDDAIGWLR